MRKIHLVESTMSGGEEGGKYIWWNLLYVLGKGEGRVVEKVLFDRHMPRIAQ